MLCLSAGAALVHGLPSTTLIPSWDIQSTANLSANLASLSLPGVDTTSWYHVPTSRCTVTGCLLAAGVYNDTELWFSDNFEHFDESPFLLPWVYRHELSISTSPDQHYFLVTNGITSKADVWLNGKQVAAKEQQSGAYGGHTYDVSSLIGSNNALVIQAYPTDYNYDFALGFVDWNPYPPDNGTGVWRDVFIKQTGPVALGPLRVTTDFKLPAGSSSATVSLKATAQNLENHAVSIVVNGVITDEDGSLTKLSKIVDLAPLQTSEIVLSTTFEKPKIWWPKQWGEQPLYTARLTGSVNEVVSDETEKHKFGIRKVTSQVSSFNDTTFFVNGERFQVIGGGYTPDMFLRWDSATFTVQAKYMLDMGLNTLRLEGKMEHPELYEICDRFGLMVIAGWECCDKWESWSYNDNLAVDPVPVWTANDLETANASMRHEALMQQTHPSMLGFLIGSDFWPDEKATPMYIKALKDSDWQVPVIASASKRGYPDLLGPGGLKMDGPYDYVPPNYWYDTEPTEDRLGSSFGFGSELGPGVGTPELGSLKKFLSQADLDELWQKPDKGLFHMSTGETFHDRHIYNEALWHRYGAPKSLEDYLMKAQMMDYEAIRAEYEGYSAMWNAERPATGLIYWMLNNAWPSLHWNQFDYYLHPAGSYFGTKVGSRLEHVAYDYVKKSVWLINHSLNTQGARTVAVEVLGLDGKVVSTTTVNVTTVANTSKNIFKISSLEGIKDVVFLRLLLSNEEGSILSRNVYWLAKTIDTLDWDNSTWYHTPITKFADFTHLDKLGAANVSIAVSRPSCTTAGTFRKVTLENQSSLPAFFIRLNVVAASGADVVPVLLSDNYITLWPHEKLELEVTTMKYTGSEKAAAIQVGGKNVVEVTIPL